jgi:cytochrome c5
MRKNIFTLTLLVAIAVLASCSSTKKTTVKKSSTTNIILSEADIQHGKQVWETSCKRCHKLYAPESHTVKQWERILPRMEKRAKLSEMDGAKVRGYIMSLAKQS